MERAIEGQGFANAALHEAALGQVALPRPLGTLAPLRGSAGEVALRAPLGQVARRAKAHGAALQAAPPHWAVVAVKCCVAGILLLPIGTPILMVASTALGPWAYTFRPIAFVVSVLLWIGLIVWAQVLTTRYPPVRSR
jgi:hypothetical protein